MNKACVTQDLVAFDSEVVYLSITTTASICPSAGQSTTVPPQCHHGESYGGPSSSHIFTHAMSMHSDLLSHSLPLTDEE